MCEQQAHALHFLTSYNPNTQPAAIILRTETRSQNSSHAVTDNIRFH